MTPTRRGWLWLLAAGAFEIGFTTCSLWSPTLKNNIAMAMIDAPHFKGEGELWAEFYIKRELIWQKRRVRCKVVPRPFFAPERRKLTPPLDR